MKLRIGAGTIISLILALVVGGYSLYHYRPLRHHAPVVENIVQGTSPQGIAPAPEYLLRHKSDLALTDAQVKQITALGTQYRRDIAPAQKALSPAATDYEKYMERQAQSPRPDSQQQMSVHGADMQRLSSVLSTTRHSYWQQARALLTAAQQQGVDRLLPKVTLAICNNPRAA